MHKKRWLAAAFSALATVSLSAQTPADPVVASPPPMAEAGAVVLTKADLDAWLDGYMPYALATGDIAGAVVAVVKDGQILSERGYGYSDVAARRPVDPKTTLFRPGSVSKLFTWTAVMQLVEQGRIDLDADVNQYLDFKIPERDGKPVTMRQMMQHAAGFEEQVKDILTHSAETMPALKTVVSRWVPKRVFAPDTTPAYSNYATTLAGYVVQRVSGESFDDYMDKHIFAPLDMRHSSFRQPLPSDLAPSMSKGYELGSDEAKPFEFVAQAPAGALSSTGEDMAHFMLAHLNNGEYDGHRILRADTAEKMHNSPLDILPPLNRMELGFFETNLNGREIIAHLGDTDYFHTSLHLLLKENTGFYVSFNSAGKEGAAHQLRIALFADFVDRYFPDVTPKDGKVEERTAKEHAALIAGTWDGSRGSYSNFLAAANFLTQMKVAADDKGGIVVPFPGLNGKPRHWTEIAPFLWRDDDSHQRLAAKVVDGKVVRWSFDMVSPFTVFDRAPWYRDSALVLPLLCASLIALLLTAITWPIAALVRRRYGAKLALAGTSLAAFHWSRLASTAIVAGVLVWTGVFVFLLKDVGNMSSSVDGLLWFAQLFGFVVFVGGFLALLWNLVAVWRGGRRWPAKTWSIALVLSALVVLWTALVLNLFRFGTNF
ncbi:MAG: beta-lactamase family protein [Proteobacteria bacterium]|uniref:serine hydrolase domain-containing protein n=1 Tax=Rudaea sp. TaxID=2136325 RepID=UPI00322054C9|nr:beta-lactamase family protein [Pseudomonadota bacterium]